MAKHDKVTPGKYSVHDGDVKECPDCFRPAPIKMYLDDEDKVLGINRTFFCRDEPVSFSMGLLTYSSVRGKEVDVIRACSSHANYHVHHWHHLRVAETKINEMYPIDSHDDLIRAHGHASHNVFPRYAEWKKEWSKKI
ncbi:hypothetical protein G9E11_02000 [Arthrobacter sp. IA7]|uniref:hypothetical protein n=1 Tax=Arthrobacter ipis TaxID=2716202 RepID=UPI001683A2DA|nr:hypothetical protein [Arthrobacter ipis]MBD1541047.1 hypothetical protein [Arthrobacter ipis]